jgi:transcriptional regulator with XRE-family HTH domain
MTSSSSSDPRQLTQSRSTVTDMDPSRLSKRTLAALEKLPPEKRARAEAIIAQTQTPEARARDAADRALLDREFRETGRIATMGEKINAEDMAVFSKFIKVLREARLARGMSLEDLALRSRVDKAALSRLESGKQSNPTIATLLRYARALDLRVTLSLEPLPDVPTITEVEPKAHTLQGWDEGVRARSDL